MLSLPSSHSLKPRTILNKEPFMAVEAGPHHSLFHPQMMLTNNSTIDINNNNLTTTPLRYTSIAHHHNPISTTTTAMYCSGAFTDSFNNFPANTPPLKAESGLTCSLPVSRKRPRDSSDFNTLNSFVNTRHQNMNQQNHNQIGSYTFLGEDISFQIQQQQLEIDQFVAHQTEKLRIEIEERRKRNSGRIIAAVEEGISKKLRAKEEEIIKMARLNEALEEKVKSLYVENQIWRELAETNEATANALRNNLNQLLEQVVNDNPSQSCCESNNEENVNDDCSSSNNNDRLCNKCGKDESCVLLLPCRHLCLCTGCASSVNVCPICKSVNKISVHVNMS